MERNYDDFTVLCPSKGRAGSISTLKLFPDMTVVVPSYQLAEYQDKHPRANIIAAPDHCDNIAKTRQWMLKTWKTVFMVDDDVMKIVKNFAAKGEAQYVSDPLQAHEIVRECYYIADQIGAKTWGFRNLRNPVEFTGHKLCKMTGYLNNSYVGFIEGHGLDYDLSYGEAEDYYISCEVALHHRFTYIEQRYAFHTKDNFLGSGGVNDVRTIEMMKENTLRLRRQYGECVQVKLSRGAKTHVHEGERSVVFPF